MRTYVPSAVVHGVAVAARAVATPLATAAPSGGRIVTLSFGCVEEHDSETRRVNCF